MASASTPAGETEGFEARVRTALGNKVSWIVLVGVDIGRRRSWCLFFVFTLPRTNACRRVKKCVYD